MVTPGITAALLGGPVDTGVLAQLRASLQGGGSPTAIVRAATGPAPTYQTLKRVLGALEAMSTLDCELSLELMVGLYPMASDAFAHDVCDAIDLWLENEGTPAVKSFLLKLQNAAPPYEAADRLPEWIELLG